MPNKILSLVTAIIMLLTIAGKATVIINANATASANNILDATGSPLATGDLIRIGFFSSEATLSTSNDFNSLNSIFTPIGENKSGSGTLSESGTTAAQATAQILIINNFGGTGGFLGNFQNVSGNYLTTGSQLYIWAFNVTDPTSFASASQWGIFKAPSWIFPPDTTSATLTPAAGSVTALRGSVNASHPLLSVVPEPSTIALLGASMGVLAFWRRGWRLS